MSLISQVKKNLGASAFVSSVNLIARLLVVPVFLAKWGSDTYGQWLVLTSIPQYMVLFNAGIATPLGNAFTIEFKSGNTVRAWRLFSGTWRYQILTSIIVTALVLAFALVFPLREMLQITALAPRDFICAIVSIVVYVFVGFQIGSISAIYRGVDLYHKYLAVQGIMALVEVGGSAILIIRDYGMVVVAMWMLGVRMFACWGLWIYGRKNVSLSEADLVSGGWSDIKKLLPTGLGFMSFPIGNLLANQTVLLIVNAFLGPTAVVTMSVCRQLSRLFLRGVQMLETAILPVVSSAFAKREWRFAYRNYVAAVGFVIASGCLFCVAVGVFGSAIIGFWTRSVNVEWVVIGVFGFEAVLLGVGSVARIVPASTNRLGPLPVMFLLSQSAGVAFVALFCQQLGVVAVGLGFAAGNLLYSVSAIRASGVILAAGVARILCDGFRETYRSSERLLQKAVGRLAVM